MPTRQIRVLQEDWSIGMFRAVAAHLIPSRGFHTGINALLDEDGSTFKRGGTTNKSTAGLGTTGLTFLWDGHLDPGRRTVIANSADFGVLDSTEGIVNLGSDGLTAPKKSALLEGILFIGGGFMYGGSRKAASFSGTSCSFTNGSKVVTRALGGFTANVDVGMLLQRASERVYVVASVDSDTQVTLRDSYEGVTGTATGVFNNIYKITAADPYESAEFYSVVANRLIVSSNEILKFSEIGKPHSFLVNDFHEVPEGHRIVGHEGIGQTCLIFTTAGAWGLDGLAFDIVDAAGNPQHRLQILSRELILWHPAGITSYQNALVIPAVDAVYLADANAGTEMLTRSIDPLYNKYVDLGYRPGTAVVNRHHLFLPILEAGSVKDVLVCRLDKPVQELDRVYYPWTQLAGQGGKVSAFAIRTGDVSRDPELLGASSKTDSRVMDCGKFFDPSGGFKNDADGTTPEYDLITRDYETGNLTKNMVRFIRTRYELIDAATDNPTLAFGYSFGDRIAATEALWDQVEWGASPPPPQGFKWAGSESEVSFTDLACPAPEEEGTDPHRCRVNKRARHIRFRIRNTEPAAVCVVRSLEMAIRPSESARR